MKIFPRFESGIPVTFSNHELSIILELFSYDKTATLTVDKMMLEQQLREVHRCQQPLLTSVTITGAIQLENLPETLAIGQGW